MQKLYDGMLLYHGSYCEVKDPDLAKCAARKELPEKLKDQYCFRTEKAINSLEFVESEKIWIRK